MADRPSRRRPFEHEWLLEPFERHTSFATRRMFGGLGVYLYDRLMLVLVEPTQSGRWPCCISLRTELSIAAI